jgi:excisionase family DNA binding protein
MHSEPLAYTVAEATKAAAVSRTELYRSVQRGELTLRKRGKRSLILADELRRWLADLPRASVTEPSAPDTATPNTRGRQALNSAPKLFTPAK